MALKSQSQFVYFISGMWCSTCSKNVSEIASRTKGVRSAQISYASKLLLIEIDDLERELDIDTTIQNKIVAAGFGVRKQTPGWIKDFQATLEKESIQILPWTLLGAVWFLAMWSSMLAFSGYLGGITEHELYYLTIASSFFGIPAILIGIFPYARSGLKALRYSGLVTLDFFIFLGGISAILISVYSLINGRSTSYADSGSMIIAILLLTKKIENSVIKKVTSSILFQLNSSSAHVMVHRNKKWIKAATDNIRRGEIIKIPSGATVPFDGILRSENAELNNHLLTGEAQSIKLKCGDSVLAGAIANSDIEMKIVNPQGERRIDDWAEAALLGKVRDTSYSKLFLKLERNLVYFAFLGAILVAGLQFFRSDSIFETVESFFVGILIFCPCLFASIVPLSRQMAHLALLRVGIILSRTDALFEINDIEEVNFDKTGTIEAVESHFEPFEQILDIETYLSDVAIKSTHPILRSLKFHSGSEWVENLTEVPGKGAVADLKNGRKLIIGRASFLQSSGIKLDKQYGLLFPLVAYDGKVVGQIVSKKVYDRRSKKFFHKMKEYHSKGRFRVLSGDPKPLEQNSFIKQIESVSYVGDLTPEEKASRMSSESIYVGDGLNDTLAMAKAKVSILMGSRIGGFAQADFQIEFPNINLVLAIFCYSKKFKMVLKQTILAAFSYNIIAIALAATGRFSPLGAVIAMLFSFSILLLSSLRLIRSPAVPV